MSDISAVKALVFDVFGTVVDWRTSLLEDLGRFGAEKGLKADWATFADDWRGLYQPAMDEVRMGRRPWTILDVLHRESLDKLIVKYGFSGLSEADKVHMNKVWHRLKPWPDSVPGLTRLKTRYIIGPLSNGNIGLLTRMAKFGGLPWDVILGAEAARAYKPLPQAYLASAELLNLQPSQVMLVAAHNGDLAAAAKLLDRLLRALRIVIVVPSRDDDIGALRGEGQSGGGPDAAGRTLQPVHEWCKRLAVWLGEGFLAVSWAPGLVYREGVVFIHVAHQVELVFQSVSLHRRQADLHPFLLAVGVGLLLVIGLGPHCADHMARFTVRARRSHF